MKKLSSADDFFTPELKTLVSNKDTPLEDVLSLPYFSKSSRLKFAPVTKYLAQHSKDLLELAFSDENSAMSASAYSVLLTGEPEILQPLFTNGWLLTTAIDLLGNKDTKDYLIGRLASVTLVCLGALDENIFDQCTFIFNFLPHCNNASAFNLLTSICDDCEDYVKLQEWLVKLHFYEYVFAEFDTIDYTYQFQKNITDNIDTTMYKDPVASKCLCLYNLLACCCQNKILQEGFLNDKLIDILIKKFDNQSKSESDQCKPPDFIRTARWKTISAATHKVISEKLANLLPEAINLISENFEKLRPYRVLSLDFISKMLLLQPKVTCYLLKDSSLAQTLILLIMKFPNSSIFHQSFREFVRAALTVPEFSSTISNIYLPIIITHSSICKPKESEKKQVTMDYYNDITMNEASGSNDVNNIEILFYPNNDKYPIREYLNNIIRLKNIKQKHKKKKTLARMIRHLFKKSENKVSENYKDRQKPSAELNSSSMKKIDNDKEQNNENNANKNSNENDANENNNENNNQSTDQNQNGEEMKKEYNIDGDFDEDDENEGNNKKDSKVFAEDDPRRVIINDENRNDKVYITDTKDTVDITQNRVIQTCFFEVVELILEAASKDKVLKDNIYSISLVKEYVNGPLKRYRTICKS